MGFFSRKKQTAIIQNDGFHGVFEADDTCCNEDSKLFFKKLRNIFKKKEDKNTECCNGMPLGAKFAIAIFGVSQNGPYGGSIRAHFLQGDKTNIIHVGNTIEITGHNTSFTTPATNGPHLLSHVYYDPVDDVTYFRSATLTIPNFPTLISITTLGFIKY
jgi:hypothetical protein